MPEEDLSTNEDWDSENVEKLKKMKKKKASACSSSRKKDARRRGSEDYSECLKTKRAESIINKCKLMSEHLAIDQLRVLTAMGGLFYAGRLSAVQAPDVYAITLDGERGNRPHIHSREEILRDAVIVPLFSLLLLTIWFNTF